MPLSATSAAANTGSAISPMLTAQMRHDCPISAGMRASPGIVNQAIAASIQTPSTGSTAPIHTFRGFTPGRASRSAATKPAAAMHSGNSTLTQNIGQNMACTMSCRTP